MQMHSEILLIPVGTTFVALVIYAVKRVIFPRDLSGSGYQRVSTDETETVIHPGSFQLSTCVDSSGSDSDGFEKV